MGLTILWKLALAKKFIAFVKSPLEQKSAWRDREVRA
jgi:hypothetical protein